jgi:hypothetical protein
VRPRAFVTGNHGAELHVTDPRSRGESGSRYLGNPGSISKKISYKLIAMNAWKKSNVS